MIGTAVRQGKADMADIYPHLDLERGTISGLSDVGFKCHMCGHEWGFELLTDEYLAKQTATESAARKRDRGALIMFHVICPACYWRHSWAQHEREPGIFDGLCRRCGTRCVEAR
jgi:hypothetical protein